MSFDVDTLQKQLPYYLTALDQKELVAGLKAISSGETSDYFLSGISDPFKSNMLQGDGWPDFELFLFDSGERRSVRGVVLSNTCDIDPDNQRETPTRIVFSPLVKLSAYKALLDKSGIDGTLRAEDLSLEKFVAIANQIG